MVNAIKSTTKTATSLATPGEVCEWCGGSGWITIFHGKPDDDGLPVRYDQVTRFRWDHSNPPLFEFAMQCPCTEQAIRQKRIDALLGDPDIPRDSLRFDFEDFNHGRYLQAVTFSRQLVDGIAIDETGEEKPGLLLFGPTGTGKTTMAAIIYRHWVERGVAAVWTDYTAFVKRIQESYGDNYQGPTRQQMIRTVSEADYMVLDDLGQKLPGKVAPATSDKVEIIYQVLAVREKRRLPTIITTNLDKDDLYAHFEARIVSRIRGLCHSVFIGGGDFRAPGDR